MNYLNWKLCGKTIQFISTQRGFLVCKQFFFLKVSPSRNYFPSKRFNCNNISCTVPIDDEVLTQDASGNIVLFNVNENVKSILAYNTMKVNVYLYRFQKL